MLKIVAAAAGECSLDEKDKFGNTALHYACANGHVAAVETLVAKGNATAKVTGQWGGTPLHFYARYEGTSMFSTVPVTYRLFACCRRKLSEADTDASDINVQKIIAGK